MYTYTHAHLSSCTHTHTHMGVAEYLLSVHDSERGFRAVLCVLTVIEIALFVIVVASTVKAAGEDNDTLFVVLALQTLYLFTIPLGLALVFGAKRDPFMFFFVLYAQYGVMIFNLAASIWQHVLLTPLDTASSAGVVRFYSGWALVLSSVLTLFWLSGAAAIFSRQFNREEFRLKELSGGYFAYDLWNRLSRPLYWSNLVSTSFVAAIFWLVIAILGLTFFGLVVTEQYFWWGFLYVLEIPTLVTTLLAAGDVSKFPATGTQQSAYILFAALLRTTVLVVSALATGIRISLTLTSRTDVVTLTFVWIQNSLGVLLFVVGLVQMISLFSQVAFFEAHLTAKLRALKTYVQTVGAVSAAKSKIP